MGLRTTVKNWLERKAQINELRRNHKIKTDTPSKVCRNKIMFPLFEKPIISIIIPFYNRELPTWNCLLSIYKHLPKTSFEIILINDNSEELIDFSLIENIRLVSNEKKLGFLKSINKGIKLAKGEYIHLLSNEITVTHGFLEELLYIFKIYSNVGAVCSKLVNKSGNILEAGCVSMSDYRVTPIVKKESYYPEINYVYKVDYTSGSSILFKKYTDENSLNLLDERFITSQLSVIDFCFNFKFEQMKDIYYTPFSEIVHHNDKSYHRQQKSLKNLKILRQKWEDRVNNIHSKTVSKRILELYNNKSIIIFYYQVPEFDNNSGDLRLTEIIKAFKSLDYHVTLVAGKNKIINSYAEYFQKLGVCIYYEHLLYSNLARFLSRTQHSEAICWFYTADVFISYNKKAQKYIEKPTLVYDMVDIHHLRLLRASQKEPNNGYLIEQYTKALEHETKASRLADIVVPISEAEARYMERLCPKEKMVVISNVHYPKIKLEDTPSFKEREGLLFIGSIHHPNVDAVEYLIKDIMPIIWKIHPHMVLNVIGNVKSYFTESDIPPNIHFHGYVSDISHFFLNCKMMVAPLRYGAGVKGKIGQAFEYYLPVVTSEVGAEGMFLTNKKNALLAESAIDFAKCVNELYDDEELWLTLQRNSEESLNPFSKKVLINKIREIEQNT